jgi:hypothetical protein
MDLRARNAVSIVVCSLSSCCWRWVCVGGGLMWRVVVSATSSFALPRTASQLLTRRCVPACTGHTRLLGSQACVDWILCDQTPCSCARQATPPHRNTVFSCDCCGQYAYETLDGVSYQYAHEARHSSTCCALRCALGDAVAGAHGSMLLCC